MKRLFEVSLAVLMSLWLCCVLIGCQTSPAVSEPTAAEVPTQGSSTGCTHSFAKRVTEATCTAEGYTCYICILCDYTYCGDNTEPLGHDYTEVISQAPAACEQDAEMTMGCIRCDESMVVVLEDTATGHLFETETIPVTCEEDGYTVYQCHCGYSYTDDVIAATGHQYASSVVAPTCTAQGYTQYVCGCGKSYAENYTASLGHEMLTITVDATCTENGFVRKVCARCVSTSKTDTAPAFGHAYGAWETDLAASCTETGKQHRTCANCQAVEQQTQDAWGHSFGDWVILSEAQPGQMGEKYHVCQTCRITEGSFDFRFLSPEHLPVMQEALGRYTHVGTVELMMQDGTSAFSAEHVKTLMAAAPKACFHYAFTLFGKVINTADTRVEFVNQQIGDAAEPEIRSALELLNQCTYFLLDNCGLSNEVLAQIRDDYPQTKVVWRIYQTNQNRSWLTDTQVLRAVYGINDTNSKVLKYLTEVKYMDLGHNTSMTDLSFCAYMPNLEIAILSGSPIKDLSPLAGCKKLEFLELAWCGHLRDISPLAGCESLKYLNISHTNAADLSPLYGLKLELLCFVNSGYRVGFTKSDWAQFQTKFPGCWITWSPMYDYEASPYGIGWRYKENWTGYTAIYKKVREVFNYDYIDSLL